MFFLKANILTGKSMKPNKKIKSVKTLILILLEKGWQTSLKRKYSLNKEIQEL